MALRIHFEDGSIGRHAWTARCGAIKIAIPITDQASPRVGTVGCSVKPVENLEGLRAGHGDERNDDCHSQRNGGPLLAESPSDRRGSAVCESGTFGVHALLLSNEAITLRAGRELQKQWSGEFTSTLCLPQDDRSCTLGRSLVAPFGSMVSAPMPVK